MKPLVLLLVLLVGLLPAQADDKPAPKLPLGQETTFATGPLDKYGYIDYEVAYNVELSKSITPEKNAQTRLMLVLGPSRRALSSPPRTSSGSTFPYHPGTVITSSACTPSAGILCA